MGHGQQQLLLLIFIGSFCSRWLSSQAKNRTVTSAKELGEALLDQSMQVITIRGRFLCTLSPLLIHPTISLTKSLWNSHQQCFDANTFILCTSSDIAAVLHTGRVHLTKENWMLHNGGTAIIRPGRHVILQSGEKFTWFPAAEYLVSGAERATKDGSVSLSVD
jgi:hypothetical protein